MSKNVDKQIDGLGQKLMSFLEAGLGRVGGGDKPSTRQPSLTSEREPAEEGDAVRPDVFTFPPVRPFSRVNPYWTDKLPRFLGAGQSFHVWQFKAEKLLRSMEVPYENWAALAAFSLEGQPLDYWMAYEKTLPPQSAITWPQFLDKLTPVFSSDMECFTAARKWESMSCSGRPTAEQIVAFLTDCMACYEAMSPKTRPPEEVAFKEVVEKLPFSLKMLILHDKVLRPQLYDKSLTDSLMTVAGMTRSLVLTLGDNGLTAEPSHKGSHPQLPSKSAQEANPRPSKRQKTVAAPGESGALQIVKPATKAAGAVGKVGDTQGLAYRGPGEEARHPGLSWDRRIMRVTLDDHLCPYCLKTGHRLTTCRLLTDQEDRRRAIIAATFVSRYDHLLAAVDTAPEVISAVPALPCSAASVKLVSTRATKHRKKGTC